MWFVEEGTKFCSATFTFVPPVVLGVGGGVMLPDFFFCSLFPVQQTTSRAGLFVV